MKPLPLPFIACCLVFLLQPACVQKNPVIPSSRPLTLVQPVAGRSYVTGDTVAITWRAGATISSVNVFVSTDNGAHEYRVAASAFGAADSCTWIIGKEIDRANLTYPSDSVRITIRDSAGQYADSTQGCLRVHALMITKPLGGHTVRVGDTVSVAWRGDRMLISSVKVLVSTDNDKTESLLVGRACAAVDSCLWIVGQESQPPSPAYPSDSVVIIVRDYDDLYSDRTTPCLKVGN